MTENEGKKCSDFSAATKPLFGTSRHDRTPFSTRMTMGLNLSETPFYTLATCHCCRSLFPGQFEAEHGQ